LEAMISCFAKLSRMATSFGKLLEMLISLVHRREIERDVRVSWEVKSVDKG
jgi:hypothetical protein